MSKGLQEYRIERAQGFTELFGEGSAFRDGATHRPPIRLRGGAEYDGGVLFIVECEMAVHPPDSVERVWAH